MRNLARNLFVILCCAAAANAQDETLRQYADQLGLDIGVCMGSQFDVNNETHNNLVKREFNTVVAENSMKAANIHPSKGTTKFDGPDKLVEFAQENDMKIRGHTLVWHSQNAGWICSGSRENALENMKYHIETIMGHFKGKIFQWDVVNEAFDDGNGNLRNSAWTQVIGNDFIDSAFVYAHAADPDCKLYYNDYSTSTINTKSNAVYDMVKRMVENGIPIHGVGFQSHQSTSDGNDALYGRIRENFERFAALGLDIAITELDARGSDFTAQARVYSTYLRIALEMPAVKTYMIWGVRDQDSWVSPTPLIFNNSWEPKDAYYAILELLKDPPEEDPTEATRFASRGRARSRMNSGTLTYNPLNNTIFMSGARTNEPVTLEMFNLKGARTAAVTIPANGSLNLGTVNTAGATTVIRSGNGAVRINTVR